MNKLNLNKEQLNSMPTADRLYIEMTLTAMNIAKAIREPSPQKIISYCEELERLTNELKNITKKQQNEKSL